MALDKDETSARILDIAETLISEGGSANLKARTIAVQAGIAVGSIYNLYGDLNHLHRAVNIRLLDRLSEAGSAAMREARTEGVADTRLRLLALARAYLTFVETHPVSWAALLAFNREQPTEDEPEDYRRRFDALFEIIAAVLAEAEIPMDNTRRRLVARVLWSSVHGIVTSGYTGHAGRGSQVWEQIDLLVTTFLEGLRGKARSAAH
jgi:AcrR family transcriptional regulator